MGGSDYVSTKREAVKARLAGEEEYFGKYR